MRIMVRSKLFSKNVNPVPFFSLFKIFTLQIDKARKRSEWTQIARKNGFWIIFNNANIEIKCKLSNVKWNEKWRK